MTIHPATAIRFWARVDTSSGLDACWPFLGARDPHGYGRLSFPTYGVRLAHRFAAMCAGLNPGEALMHECDNPPCCNPLHLTPGDIPTNNRQAWARERFGRGENHPSARFPDVTVAIVRARVAAGETQRAVAASLGISQTHVSRLVTFKRRAA